jgi:DUF917 family protein
LKNLTRQEIEDLITGAAILGVGGGGSPERGMKSVLEQFDSGKSVTIAKIDEFEEDSLLVSPYFVGSVAPSQSNKSRPVAIKDPIDRAIKLLESRLGREVSGTVASEIGGGNTAASLSIASKLGVPMLDGDLMGRAGPELHQSTMHIFGLSMAPASVVSSSGNEIIVEKYSSIDDYEALARYASVISGGHVAVVDSPLSREQARSCVIHDTISRSIGLGKERREALEHGRDPIQAVIRQMRNGRVLFRGEVSSFTWRDERGFLFGEVLVDGEGELKGKKLKSWIMNEHIMCWIDEKPAVMPPDLYAFLEQETASAITNNRLAEGMKVVVVGASIDEVWRTPKGLELFGPRRFGFDYDYVPIENLSEVPVYA